VTKADQVLSKLPGDLRKSLIVSVVSSGNPPASPEAFSRAVMQELAIHAIQALVKIDRGILWELLFEEPQEPMTEAPNATTDDYTVPNHDIPTAVFAKTKTSRFAPEVEDILNRLKKSQKQRKK
jgi:hypothetical protein